MAFLLELPLLAHDLLRIQKRKTDVRKYLRSVQIQTLEEKVQVAGAKSYLLSTSE